jgi:regulator of replication initiation timing
MTIEAMKQALESLSYVMSHGVAVRQAKDILTAAIEQAEKQQFNPDWDAMGVMVEEQQRMAAENETLKRCLFQMQEAAKELAEKQEPVAWYHAEDYNTHFTTNPSEDMIGVYWKPLYTAPPQREWHGLTDEEKTIAYSMYEIMGAIGYTQAIEAKLKEKNA